MNHIPKSIRRCLLCWMCLSSMGWAGLWAQTFHPPDTLNQLPGAAEWADLHSADVTGDGYADVLLLGRGSSPIQGVVAWMENNGAGVLLPPQLLATNAASFVLRKATMADLDGNGLQDLVFAETTTTSGYTEHLFWLPALGGGLFDSLRLLNPVEKLKSTEYIATGDLDGNERVDVVVFHQSRISIFPNAATAAPGLVQRVSTTSGPQGGTLADLNGDGFPEVVYAEPGRIAMLANYAGDSLASMPSTLLLGPPSSGIDGINRLAVADLDLDGDMDIAYNANIAPSNDGLFWTANQGDGTFGPGQYLGVLGAQYTTQMSVEDLNGDGLPDISVRVPGRSLQVAYGLAPGQFDTPEEQILAPNDFTATAYSFADVDLDGHLDALQSGSAGGFPSVYQVLGMKGSGVCTTSDRPGDQMHRFTASGELVLHWRSTRNAEACQIQAQTLDGILSGKRVVLAPDQASVTLPLAAFPAGSSWTWRTACACSISPLERTAWSGYKDTFHIPAARAMQTGPLEATPVALQISPNPASTSLRVSFEGTRVGAEAVVLDLQGRIQHVFALPGEIDRKGSGTFDLDVSSWPEGIYFLHMPDGSTASFSVVH